MDKKNVIDFFDNAAATWDESTIRNDGIINIILDNTDIKKGTNILDVACGTGVLIPDYLNRGVSSVTAVDVSPRMADIAKDKYKNNSTVSVICADAEEYDFKSKFDRIVVYNAFPHFTSPEGLIKKLSSLLKVGGVLTVAHSMSKAALDSMHNKSARNVSLQLPEADDLAGLFAKYLSVTKVISNDEMYQVVGKKL